MTSPSPVKVAVVQAAPVPFDRDAITDRVCELIHEAASEGAKFILFPEALIPAYPRGLNFGMVVGSRSPEGRKVWQRYWETAVDVPGRQTELIGKAAREAGVFAAIGVIERDSTFSRGTLYCTLVYFGPHGELLGKHRKLKPTGSERLIWGEGDGSTLTVIDTPFGRVGGLICWENYMPLARMAMYGKGLDIYLAPTADSRDSWHASMRHIACESRCFVLSCNQFMTKDMYPEEIRNLEELKDQPDIITRGGSAIISPFGEVIEGPLYDRDGILYAELDMAEVVRARVDFDVTGHYARADIFTLTVNEEPALPVKGA